MNYFKNNKNQIFAYDDEQVAQGYGKDLEEILAPIYNWKVLFCHKNINQVQLKEDGSYYLKYNEDGTPDLVYETQQVIKQIQKETNEAIQYLLDTKAQEFRYDNMMSVRSYAGYANPFQAEAQALAIWGANCWVKAGEIEAQVLASTRPMPTIEEVLAEMPVYL